MELREETRDKAILLIDKLYNENDLRDEDLLWLLDNMNKKEKEYMFSLSKKTRDKYYGKNVYLRSLIEFTNYCKRECIYCGINAYNKKANRYRLTKEEIVEACKNGKSLGYNTFVLQGGEDPYFTDEKMCEIIKEIKRIDPNCAITLSMGERSYESYKALKDSGADRYLLRHETSNPDYYKWLHPKSVLDTRVECIKNLKKLGFQTGTGIMVGLPGYTNKDYVRDLRFIKTISPEMVGLGPFITHKDTEMREYKSGDIDTTLTILSMVRLLLPKVLLPATTALASIAENGRKAGLDVGSNVIMPNLTPVEYRGDYMLYNSKKSSGSESAQALNMIKNELDSFGYICNMSRGDSKMCVE
ncbi:[FeFe] hydrogenase H-cluster radical SAM maturase HydE [Peptostreptococcus faecalis]|uniref:[FeFe] hydrogenase H-cluster radical SAM maturase HydE n=1 Tax=Peptostreptococcus faecalis TaxID=2045015 RepID=UPI000C7D1744|nr:[FeFe] hydrogenase H-cluster radical SAM maturase HydE [Peptostreptococcus faecalis]